MTVITEDLHLAEPIDIAEPTVLHGSARLTCTCSAPAGTDLHPARSLRGSNRDASA